MFVVGHKNEICNYRLSIVACPHPPFMKNEKKELYELIPQLKKIIYLYRKNKSTIKEKRKCSFFISFIIVVFCSHRTLPIQAISRFCRTQTNWQELQIEMVELFASWCSTWKHHTWRTASYSRAPWSLGKPVIKN